MFSTDQNQNPAPPAPDRAGGDVPPPTGEWGWMVTPDGRVLRATVSNGVVHPDRASSQAA